MLVFGILNFAHNLAECRLLFEIGTLNSLDVVEFWVAGLLGPLALISQIANILFDLLALSIHILVTAVNLIFLGTNLHKFLGASLKLALNLLKITTFLEKVFRGMAALVF
jgi:hypothetical protein